MCSTNELKQDWKRLPDSQGDWLWVCCFSCGCIIESGIAWVTEYHPDGNEQDRYWKINDKLQASWESNPPKSEPEHINAWMKVSMPKDAWLDEKTEDPAIGYYELNS